MLMNFGIILEICYCTFSPNSCLSKPPEQAETRPLWQRVGPGLAPPRGLLGLGFSRVGPGLAHLWPLRGFRLGGPLQGRTCLTILGGFWMIGFWTLYQRIPGPGAGAEARTPMAGPRVPGPIPAAFWAPLWRSVFDAFSGNTETSYFTTSIMR